MRYDYSLTVAAGKSESSPAKSVVKLCHGNIVRVEVFFPAGQNGLVHAAILRYGHRLYPTNNDGSFIGDDKTHTITGSFPLLEVPYEVTLLGWSPGAALSHTVYFGFEIDEPEEIVEAAPKSVLLPEEIEE